MHSGENEAERCSSPVSQAAQLHVDVASTASCFSLAFQNIKILYSHTCSAQIVRKLLIPSKGGVLIAVKLMR